MLGAYARLNEERRGILERVGQEGTVHRDGVEDLLAFSALLLTR
jgi:hypothetical protein